VYFTLKALVRSLVLPPAGPLLLAAVGILLIWRRRQRVGWALLLTALLASWLLATPLVADALSRLADRYPPLNLDAPTGAQAIVILGGGGARGFAPEYGGPAAGSVLLERVTFGAFVARRTGLPLLVTGTSSEAAAMRATLSRSFGLSTRWLDDRARDTYGNAHDSARLLRAAGVKRIILVTSSEHLLRAAHEFQDAGLEVVPAPEGLHAPELNSWSLVPSPAELMRSYAAIYELIGEPLRKLLHAMGLRERFDPQA